MYQNQMNVPGSGYPQPNMTNQGVKFELPQENKNLFIGFIVFFVVMVIGCFFPFVLQKATNVSVNYISYEGSIKDGVFLIVLGVIALALAFKQKYLISMILQIISAVILACDFIDALDTIKEANTWVAWLGDDYKIQFGIGFYIVLIGTVGALVCVFLLWKKTKGQKASTPIPNVAGQPMYNQPMNNQMPMNNFNQPTQPVQPAQTNCPYCGTPNSNGSAFCANCGAKF